MKTFKKVTSVQDGKIIVRIPESFGKKVEITVSQVKDEELHDWPDADIKYISGAIVEEPASRYAPKGAPSEANQRTVEVSVEKNPLKDLVALLVDGKEVILTESGKPVARLVLVRPRVLGLHDGSVWTSDDFDAPLPDEFWLGEQ